MRTALVLAATALVAIIAVVSLAPLAPVTSSEIGDCLEAGGARLYIKTGSAGQWARAHPGMTGSRYCYGAGGDRVVYWPRRLF